MSTITSLLWPGLAGVYDPYSISDARAQRSIGEDRPNYRRLADQLMEARDELRGLSKNEREAVQFLVAWAPDVLMRPGIRAVVDRLADEEPPREPMTGFRPGDFARRKG